MKPQDFLQANLITETHQLGQSMATYRCEWRPARKLSIGCLQTVALAMVALYPWALFLANPRAFREIATVCLSITGLFFFALLVLFVGIWSHTISPRHVLFCAEGFVYTQGRKVQAVRWDEVDTFQKVKGELTGIESLWYMLRWYILRREVPFIPPYRFSLRTKQGTTFRFRETFLNLALAGSFADISERFHAELELADRMEREISIRLWEKTVAAYQAGHPVIFGKVQVSRQGVHIRREVRSWNEIDSLALYDDEGVIREFKSSEPSSDTHEETNISLPASDLNSHLAYWQEEVSPVTWIVLGVKDQYAHGWEWCVSEVPNALVFVALIAYALHQH